MQLTIAELASKIGATILCGDPCLQLTGFASLADARAADLAFLADNRYISMLANSQAGAVLVKPDMELPKDSTVALLAVDDSAKEFSALLAEFGPKRPKQRKGIHPSAVIDPEAELAEEVTVGANAVIEAGVKVGSGAVIGPACVLAQGASVGEKTELVAHVTIGDGCHVGARCLLHAGVVIGADGFGFEFSNGAHQKVPQNGNVIVGDDVEIGANSCVDRARFGSTRIGSGSKIDNLVQVGHNCDLGEHNIVCALVGLAGSCRTGRYVTLAAQAGVAGHLSVGDGCTVAGRGGVTKDIGPGGVWAGFPITDAAQWRKAQLSVAKLPEMRRKLKQIENKLEQ